MLDEILTPELVEPDAGAGEWVPKKVAAGRLGLSERGVDKRVAAGRVRKRRDPRGQPLFWVPLAGDPAGPPRPPDNVPGDAPSTALVPHWLPALLERSQALGAAEGELRAVQAENARLVQQVAELQRLLAPRPPWWRFWRRVERRDAVE